MVPDFNVAAFSWNEVPGAFLHAPFLGPLAGGYQ
jgi:hypothetical protein